MDFLGTVVALGMLPFAVSMMCPTKEVRGSWSWRISPGILSMHNSANCSQSAFENSQWLGSPPWFVSPEVGGMGIKIELWNPANFVSWRHITSGWIPPARMSNSSVWPQPCNVPLKDSGRHHFVLDKCWGRSSAGFVAGETTPCLPAPSPIPFKTGLRPSVRWLANCELSANCEH